MPFLRSQNVRPAKLDLGGSLYIQRVFHEANKKSHLKPGNLLVVRVGVNRGDTCIAPDDLGEVNCANVIFSRSFTGVSDYLSYFQTPFCQKTLRDLTTGSAQGVVDPKDAAGVPAGVAAPAEQQEIARRVAGLFAPAGRIEARFTQARAQVGQLTSSLLAKAFRGELVPQDPTDEPAAKSLRRIRVHKPTAKMKPNPPTRRAICPRSVTVTVGITVLSTLLVSSASAQEARPLIQKGDIPIIDVHTHIFNLDYVPCAGIAQAHSATVAPVDAISGSLEKLITRIAEGLARRSALCGEAAHPKDADTKLDVRSLASNVAGETGKDLEREIAALELTKRDYEQLARFVGADLERLNITDSPSKGVQSDLVRDTLLKAVILPLLAEEPSEGLTIMKEEPSRKWIWNSWPLWLSTERRIVRTMRDNYPDVDLFVHHMMDMQAAYGNDKPYFDFEKQICRMKDLAESENAGNTSGKGSLVHFVAFDPFRRDQALPMVMDGLMNGAIGVKFYPPSGYRPAGNEIPPKPKGWLQNSRERRLWNAKYDGLTDAKLDDLAMSLLSFCESNDIPVFTHCTPIGFYAAKGYGTNADPCYWAIALNTHSNLSLCFGHAGGGAWWFSTNSTSSGNVDPARSGEPYGGKVVELCLRYPNVYCEVGHLEEVLLNNQTPEKAAFAQKMADLLNRPSADGKWRLGDKIMYGTDWHMLNKYRNCSEYLARFEALFDHENLKDWKRQFFAANAAKFLRLEQQADSPNLSMETRRLIRRLCDRIKSN